MKIGIYLGDIKKPRSLGQLNLELSFVNALLEQEVDHEFVIYWFGERNIFEHLKDYKNVDFVCLNYFKKPEVSFSPFCFKTSKVPLTSLNLRLKKDRVNLMLFLVPYLAEHIEIPYFAIIRDVAHRVLPHFPEFSTNKVFTKTEEKLQRFLMGASKIITGNNLSKTDIKTLYDIIDENIIISPMPYPVWVKNAKEERGFLEKNNLQKNGYIIYPAQFWSHKNHIRLLLAAQIMKEQNINLKVVFCGHDKGNKSYLREVVEEFDIGEEVLFLDYVSYDELSMLYKNAYALVYPSLAGVDSICALEAMYFSCPVLISNNEGYNIQLKNAALYFNPLDEADIVEKITSLNDVALKDELIAKGQLLVQENNCLEFINKFLNIADDFYMTRRCWSLEESYRAK